ncbi:MAG: hypothetical protein AVDCRST_MAG68-539 [uncultured Gemmatimonadetes bacterium]|uniref:Lipoprotein n=1 Tax=uncultured Gemmatimonadota bacterium TaxID=203437 RepID=A0A6J4K9I5_9BACT|nr:MAG: hypothetical protein AVDCRST_MAG68-539 [uncultured Gemmatimonadota bacterium]
MSPALRFVPVFLLLSGCASAPAAGSEGTALPRPAAGPPPVRVHSDTTGGTTRYVTDAADLRATGALETPPLRLSVGASCRGAGCAPTSFLLFLTRRAPDIQIVQDTRVVLNADGVDIVSSTARYSSRPVELGVTEEQLVLPLHARQLRALVGAQVIFGNVGPVRQFEVTPAAREVLRRMAALAPAAP